MMKAGRFALLLAALCGALGAADVPAVQSGAPAQAATPEKTPSPPEAPLQFRAGTAVVVLDLVVRDKSGRPVRDLKPSEVVVLENGQACEVRWFRRVEGAPAAASSSGVAREPVAAAPRADAGPPVERVAPGITLASLVFDSLAIQDAATAAKAANAFVDRFLGPTPSGREQVAVFRMGVRLAVLQPFTPDPDAVRKAIAEATSGRYPRERSVTREALQAAVAADQAGHVGLPMAPTRVTDASTPTGDRATPDSSRGGVDAAFREVVARALRLADELQREQQGNDALRSLIALTTAQGALPGRKTLLLFSPGLQVPGPLEELYRTVVSTANRSNVSVYAVDVRGLGAISSPPDLELAGDAVRQAATESMLQQQAGAGTSRQMKALDRASDALRLNAQQTMSDLAEQTGGFLLANVNDFTPAIVRVAAEVADYYELAYVPAKAEFDGAFRKIDVRVSRRDVVVHSRSGYFAQPLPDEKVQPFEVPLLAALASPLDSAAGAPAHRAAALRFADAGPFPEVLLLVDVPQSGLTFETPAGEQTPRYHGRIAIVGLVRDERGLVLARLSHEAALEGPAASLDGARAQSVTVDRTLRLPAGRYVFETAVQDGPSGRIGRRRTAFEVPERAAGPVLGSVAIVLSEKLQPGAVRRLPLQAGDVGALPALGRPFPERTAAISLFLTAQPDEQAGPAELALEFRRDGHPVARATPQLPAPDALGRVAYVGSFPSATLAPGRYEVWARLRQGTQEATEATSFVIAPSPRPQATAEAPRADASSASAVARERKLKDSPSATPPLATILDRAAEYVARYEQTFRNVLAEELYRQWLVTTDAAPIVARTLRSELVYVAVPGSLPWGTFRDIVELDGQPLKDRSGRLERLFGQPAPTAIQQAQEILKEGARYNLGLTYRNVNAPTLAMLLLLPENQRRLELTRKGERTIGGLRGVEVEFRELASPTLVRDQWGNDIRSHGRFWIDPARGAVLRSEIEYDLAANSMEDLDRRQTGFVATQYRSEPSWDVLVPDEMKELYKMHAARIEGTARYPKYRRFEVTTGADAARLPEDKR